MGVVVSSSGCSGVLASPCSPGEKRLNPQMQQGTRRNDSQDVREESVIIAMGTPRVANTPAIWNNRSSVSGKRDE